MFLVRARWRTGATVQVAVEDIDELFQSIAHFDDAGFTVEIIDAAGAPVDRVDLAALANPVAGRS